MATLAIYVEDGHLSDLLDKCKKEAEYGYGVDITPTHRQLLVDISNSMPEGCEYSHIENGEVHVYLPELDRMAVLSADARYADSKYRRAMGLTPLVS